MKDNIGLKGILKIQKFEQDKLIEEYEYTNLITNVGLDYLLKLIGGDTTGGINKMAVGSGITAASKSDTTLVNKIILLDVTRDYTVPNRVNFITRIPENTFATTKNYNEAGLVFKTDTMESLITRLVFTDTLYQQPQNSLSLLYSLELQV